MHLFIIYFFRCSQWNASLGAWAYRSNKHLKDNVIFFQACILTAALNFYIHSHRTGRHNGPMAWSFLIGGSVSFPWHSILPPLSALRPVETAAEISSVRPLQPRRRSSRSFPGGRVGAVSLEGGRWP